MTLIVASSITMMIVVCNLLLMASFMAGLYLIFQQQA